uniref:Uncharacterized protein n=1 Tax=Panagrolaimus superbus TaxID=310955 RepID=A0A914Y1W1_9BILA
MDIYEVVEAVASEVEAVPAPPVTNVVSVDPEPPVEVASVGPVTVELEASVDPGLGVEPVNGASVVPGLTVLLPGSAELPEDEVTSVDAVCAVVSGA